MFHTRTLRHVRSLLTDDVAQTVACSIVASRLDYCNALLCGAPAATFDRLQRVQNNLTRVVCQSRGRTDARPLLRSLHWLPVRQRVNYKVALLNHSHSGVSISDLIQTHVPIRTPVRSSDAPLLAVRPTDTYRTGSTRFLCRSPIRLELYLLTFDCARAFPYLSAT